MYSGVLESRFPPWVLSTEAKNVSLIQSIRMNLSRIKFCFRESLLEVPNTMPDNYYRSFKTRQMVKRS